jgi:hypothetical protein
MQRGKERKNVYPLNQRKTAILRLGLALACFALVPIAQSMRDECASGYVWREARPTDHVCVTPESRSLVKQENSRAQQRWTAGAYGPHTCTQGYVWREAFKGDDVCVTPERRDQVREENRVANSRRAGGRID